MVVTPDRNSVVITSPGVKMKPNLSECAACCHFDQSMLITHFLLVN